MSANVTSIIHFFKEERSQALLANVGRLLGLVIVDAKSIEDVNWLSTKLERYLIVVSDSLCELADINAEAPVIFIDAGKVALLESLGKTVLLEPRSKIA
jgi:hypothetical protein